METCCNSSPRQVSFEPRTCAHRAATRQREIAVWNALPAVRHHRIFEINDERLAIPGPRLPDGIRLFASLLHPDAMHQAQ